MLLWGFLGVFIPFYPVSDQVPPTIALQLDVGWVFNYAITYKKKKTFLLECSMSRNEFKCFLFFSTIHVHPAMSKNPKQHPNCIEKGRNNPSRSNRFKGCHS
jgi:hypothetical protein